MIDCVKITGLEMSSVERSLRNPKRLGLFAAVGGAVALSAALACGDNEGISGITDSREPTPFPTSPGSQSIFLPRPTDSFVSDLKDADFVPASERAQIGDRAPNIPLRTFEGRTYELNDLLGKKPIMFVTIGYIDPEYENLSGVKAIKSAFGDALEVVVLTHYSEATRSPEVFPLHIATEEFVERYTNQATHFYLIDSQGILVYSAHWIFGNEPQIRTHELHNFDFPNQPHALIRGLIEYSESQVKTNGAFSLPYEPSHQFRPDKITDDLRDEVRLFRDSDFFSAEEVQLMEEIVDEARAEIESGTNNYLIPVTLTNLGRLVLERYCQTPNESLDILLVNIATATHYTYLQGVQNGDVAENLWDLLRYSFDTNCQLSAFGDEVTQVLDDGSWVYGNAADKVIGASKRDRETL